MVDGLSANVGRIDDRRVAATARVSGSAKATDGRSVPVAAEMKARAMAVQPPVDAERVRAIRAAIEDGSFPISPARVADQLIALRYEWMNDDQA